MKSTEDDTSLDTRNKLLHARVKVTSGTSEGREGTIIKEAKGGWYYLDNVDAPLRTASFKVLSYAEPASPISSNSFVNRTNIIDDGDGRALLGATVKIRPGTKCSGLIGIIKEHIPYRHLRLEGAVSTMFHAKTDVDVIKYGNSKSSDFCEKYRGGTVKVIREGEFKGLVSKVQKVVVGDWYITDNKKITKAYPAHRFEVLKYSKSKDEEYSEDDGHESNGVYKLANGTWRVHLRHAKRKWYIGVFESKTRATQVSTAALETLQKIPDAGTGDANKIVRRVRCAVLFHTDAVDSETKPAGNHFSGEGDGQDTVSPFIGATVHIISGSYKGKTGKVLANNGNGWWKIEGIEGNINSSWINFVNDETTNFEAIRRYYSPRSTRMPDIIRIPQVSIEEDSEKNVASEKDEDLDVAQSQEVETSENDEGLDKDDGRAAFLGATVYSTTGANKGKSGKVCSYTNNGYFVTDEVGKVRPQNLLFIQDDTTNFDAIREYWYSQRGLRMPFIFKSPEDAQEAMVKAEKEAVDREKEAVERRAAKRRPKAHKSDDESVESDDDAVGLVHDDPRVRKIAQTDFSGKKRKLGVDRKSCISRAPYSTPNYDGKHGKKKRAYSMVDRSVPRLDPVLLQPTISDEQLMCQSLLAGFKDLPMDTKIDIFNRKTGRIMSDSEAISLSALPKALLNHAEYEPVVPANSAVSSQVGRSGHNIRVSNTVVPQTRVRGSAVEGRQVLVTGGEYRGLNGKIEAAIPGGWYLVRDLFQRDKSNVVISSENLHLVPNNKPISGNDQTTSSDEPQGDYQSSVLHLHKRAAELRLQRCQEEKKFLEMNDSTEYSERISKLENEIGRTARFCKSLETKLK